MKYPSPAALVGLLATLVLATARRVRERARRLLTRWRVVRSFAFGSAGRRYPPPSAWLAAAAGATLAVALIAWPAVSPRIGQPGKTRPQLASAGKVEAVDVAAVRPNGERPSTPTDAVELPDVEPENLAAPASPIVQTGWREPEAAPVSAADLTESQLADVPEGEAVPGEVQRRLIEVPAEGLEVTEADATFENVDFVAARPASPNGAMLVLRGSNAVFRGCSFQTNDEVAAGDLPAAIRLDDGVDSVAGDAGLSAGAVEIRDSVFRRVKAAVSCRVAGETAVRLDNVLHLGPGPGVEFDRFPKADEVLLVGLSRMTVRGARSVVEIGCDRLPALPGRLEIDAADCAFILPAAGAVVEYRGATRPGPLLKGLRWSGRGSVLSPRSRLALWRTPEGRMLAAPDQAVPIEGVVRAEVDFAGRSDEGPAASRIVRWQAPLGTPHPPGVEDGALHLPNAKTAGDQTTPRQAMGEFTTGNR